jgi:hypothetical protein
MGWDGMGWDGMGWDGMGWDGMGWDGMGWDGMGWDGMGWTGPGRALTEVGWALAIGWAAFERIVPPEADCYLLNESTYYHNICLFLI